MDTPPPLPTTTPGPDSGSGLQGRYHLFNEQIHPCKQRRGSLSPHKPEWPPNSRSLQATNSWLSVSSQTCSSNLQASLAKHREEDAWALTAPSVLERSSQATCMPQTCLPQKTRALPAETRRLTSTRLLGCSDIVKPVLTPGWSTFSPASCPPLTRKETCTCYKTRETCETLAHGDLHPPFPPPRPAVTWAAASLRGPPEGGRSRGHRGRWSRPCLPVETAEQKSFLR